MPVTAGPATPTGTNIYARAVLLPRTASFTRPKTRGTASRADRPMPLIRGLDVGGVTCPAVARSNLSCSSSSTAGAGRFAFIIAGAAMHLQRPLAQSYVSHVLDAFGAHSRTQLFLHVGHAQPRRSGEAHPLDAAIDVLRPAAVEVVPLEHHTQTAAAGTCLPPGPWPSRDYQRRALRWWGALNASWAMVLEWEQRQADLTGGGQYSDSSRGVYFRSVFFSRADLVFTRPFGPACAYDKALWYTAGIGAPDMLWLMPRWVASSVMGTLGEFLACAAHADVAGGARRTPECCQLQTNGSKVDVLRLDDFRSSFWPLSYWTRRLKIGVSTALRGSAELPRSGAKLQAHLGCGAPNCGRRDSCQNKTLRMSEVVRAVSTLGSPTASLIRSVFLSHESRRPQFGAPQPK